MLPSTALVFAQPLGPRDTLDYYLAVTQGADADDILADGETVTSFHIALTAEAIAAGLMIMSDTRRAPILSAANVIQFWVQVASAYQTASIFDAGVLLGVEVTLNTSEGRIKTRTAALKVVNQ